MKIYEHHYPKHKRFGDITKLDVANLPDFDVLTGGFPCQSFSMAGERQGFKDRRGKMIFYLYDILKAKQPKYAVFENVKGISNHDGGKTMKSVMKLLHSAGYHVRVVLLNSAHYGSAQARERVVFICRLGEDFPAKAPEIRDASKRFRDFKDKDESHWRFASERTIQRMRRQLLDTSSGGFNFVGGYDRVNTITTGISTSGRKYILVQEGEKMRYLTELEGELLQGFAPGWTDVPGVSRADRWFAIGNAVNGSMSKYLFTDYLKGLWW